MNNQNAKKWREWLPVALVLGGGIVHYASFEFRLSASEAANLRQDVAIEKLRDTQSETLVTLERISGDIRVILEKVKKDTSP